MQAQSWNSPPVFKFLKVLLLPSLIWLLICWSLTGLLYPDFWLAPTPTYNSIQFNPDGWKILYSDTFNNWNQAPGICKFKKELTDVESKICQDYGLLLRQRSVLSLAPWVVWLIFLIVTHFFFHGFYSRAAHQINKNQPKLAGKVLAFTPPLKNTAQSWFFEKFFCLRPLYVELPNKSVQVAYTLPQKGTIPPGQAVLLYEVNSFWGGGRRYLAVFHYPHVAVFRGG